jgi:hypothetical protein
MGARPSGRATLGQHASTRRFIAYLGTQPLRALAFEQHRPRCLRREHYAEAAAEPG